MIPGEAFLPEPPAASLPDDVAPPPPGAPGSPECPIPLGPATIIADPSSAEPAPTTVPEPEPPAPVDPWGVTDPTIFETPEPEEVWTPTRPAVAFFDQDVPTEQVPAVVAPPVHQPEIVGLPDISVTATAAVAEEPPAIEAIGEVEIRERVPAPPDEELKPEPEPTPLAAFAPIEEPEEPEEPEETAEETPLEPEIHDIEPELHEVVRSLPPVPPPNTGAAVATVVAPARLGVLDARGLDQVAVDVNPEPITRLEPDWGKAKRARSLVMLIVLTLIIATAVAAALAVGVELISVWANNAISKSAGS